MNRIQRWIYRCYIYCPPVYWGLVVLFGPIQLMAFVLHNQILTWLSGLPVAHLISDNPLAFGLNAHLLGMAGLILLICYGPGYNPTREPEAARAEEAR